ncbi:MAG: ATP-binding cassette domain-containing protein [Acidimicrobiales bacterium]
MELRDSLRTVDPAVECRGVTRRFRTARTITVALDAVSLSCLPASITVVAGASGSGKSTLLSMIAALDRPDDGLVLVDGRDVGALSRRRRRALRAERVTTVLPQPSDNLFDHLDTVDNLRWSAGLAGTRELDTVAALAQVGLAERSHHAVRQLSGGEQQRLAIACALASGTPVLAADEPTASLDRRNADSVIAALLHAAGTGRCVVVATHDPDVIAVADQVVWLDHGRRVA